MAHFIRLLSSENNETDLQAACSEIKRGASPTSVFEVQPAIFKKVPNAPFVYWVSEKLLDSFKMLPQFETTDRSAWVGLQSGDDFQWLRLFWESPDDTSKFFSLSPIAKGGGRSDFYSEYPLSIRWGEGGDLIRTWKTEQLRKSRITANNSKLWNESRYFQPGVTWSRRAHLRGSFRLLPKGCVFSDSSPCAFESDLLTLVSILNSTPYLFLLSLLMPRGSEGGQTLKYETGYVTSVPIPEICEQDRKKLRALAKEAWAANYSKSITVETSRNFVLPDALHSRLGQQDPTSIEAELTRIQVEINDIAFDLYGFSDADRTAALGSHGLAGEGKGGAEDGAEDPEEGDEEELIDQTDALLSWTIGIAFGRFDWRLATGEREAAPEPDPFDPLPTKSSGMLPDGTPPFHAHSGILVDDHGHPHDLARLIEEVLNRVDVSVPDDVRPWLQRDFFAFHLQRYSKSRRKAPIYWPLSTASGSYTLWVYYPSLNNQTLFTAVNDFLDGPNGKLTQVSRECAELRIKGSGRSRDEEKQYEMLQTFAQELTDLRDALLKIAPTYQPNHDDGVQITAAPLWQLFRHKPWQKVLKDTWIKLEKGEYDWAHLAIAYWPDRVREKCKNDKSLAISHGLEDLYVEPEAAPKKTRGKRKTGGEE